MAIIQLPSAAAMRVREQKGAHPPGKVESHYASVGAEPSGSTVVGAEPRGSTVTCIF